MDLSAPLHELQAQLNSNQEILESLDLGIPENVSLAQDLKELIQLLHEVIQSKSVSAPPRNVEPNKNSLASVDRDELQKSPNEQQSSLQHNIEANDHTQAQQSLGKSFDPTTTAGGAISKKKKKKSKQKGEDHLAERANTWQNFATQGGKKKIHKSMFASPEEGQNGKVGFHGSKNQLTANPDRVKHQYKV